LEDGYTLHLVARRAAEGQPSSGTSEENTQDNGKSDISLLWIHFHDLLYILGVLHDVVSNLPCVGVIGAKIKFAPVLANAMFSSCTSC
jgi:hypothetical protein